MVNVMNISGQSWIEWTLLKGLSKSEIFHSLHFISTSIYLFNFLRERENTCEQWWGGEGREKDPKQAPRPLQSQTWASISALWDHNLSHNQGSAAQQTVPPRRPWFIPGVSCSHWSIVLELSLLVYMDVLSLPCGVVGPLHPHPLAASVHVPSRGHLKKGHKS